MSNDGQARPDDKDVQAQQEGRNATTSAMSDQQRDERSREELTSHDAATNAMSDQQRDERSREEPAGRDAARAEGAERSAGSTRAQRAVGTELRPPAEEDIVSPMPVLAEREVEASLRPKRLSEFPGQPKVREQLELVLESAVRRSRPPDHVLLSGPPGLGKTSLAMIIATELSAPIRVTSGPAIERAGDLAALLTSLGEGEVLFIDEIHRVARPAEELLYMAMEDFRVDVMVGKGPGATAIPLELAPFTLVGATTRAGLLTGPLRDRFGFTGHLDFYDVTDLETILRRSASLLGVALRDDGGAEIAGRSRGTPRIANRLLRRVRDFAEVRADGVVTEQVARDALAVYDVDELGLDRLDRAVLDALVRRFGGGPVGVGTLGVAVGEEVETVEEVAEPYLVRAGLLARTPRGRVATPAAWAHLGLTPPRDTGAATLFDE
jgi:Holliday junction DNA helicase RuvB